MTPRDRVLQAVRAHEPFPWPVGERRRRPSYVVCFHTETNAISCLLASYSPNGLESPFPEGALQGVVYVPLAVAEQMAVEAVQAEAKLAKERATVATLVEALRRVRDEAEYARDLREAAYMADKHVTHALFAIENALPHQCSRAYTCRREHNQTLKVFKTALEEVREELVELLPHDDADEDERFRGIIDDITRALADEGPRQ